MKDVTELQELRDTIAEILPKVVENQRLAMTVLEQYHWGEAMARYWADGILFCKIAIDSNTFYLELIDHCIKLERDHGWEYSTVTRQYHSKLTDIRVNSLTRFSALVGIYIYLRDARAQASNAPKLQEK